MITVRKAEDRFHTLIDWLDSRHSFSFGEHYDPEHMGFRALRVINDDRVRAGMGFGTHPHRDMEIVSYVLDGALEHRDSMGNGSTIVPGDVQRMTAGTGVRHSEYNPSKTDDVRFLQIWLVPERPGLRPSYEQKTFPTSEKAGKLRLVASRDGRDGSVTVHQEVDLYATVLAPGERVELAVRPGRKVWVQVAKGAVEVNGTKLGEGDGAALRDEAQVALTGTTATEVLVFDLA